MNNVLDLVDHTIFRLERAAGVTNLIQVAWMYDRGVDFDGLRRFHDHLRHGRLSRRIELSPLPFGRYRWVSPTDRPQLEIVTSPRPREEFDTWLQEQSATPLDAESGPGWHVAVLPFTDGGAGVSLVASHCLTDGIGLCEALADAVDGHDNAIAWPAAGARRRWQAVREDARQTIRDLPGAGRAVVAAARFARRHRGSAGASLPAPSVGADDVVTPSTATVFVDLTEWDERARRLGGTSNALLAGVAATLARRVGRVGGGGLVTLTIPISQRTAGDTRANAITNVDITVDPKPATTDLRGIRAAVKQALVRSADRPDDRWTLLPLVPLVPERLGKRWVGAATNSANSVGSSHLGAIPPSVNRPDGTDADLLAMRSLSAGVTEAAMVQLGGQLLMVSGQVNGRVFITVVAYQPNRVLSKKSLHQHISSVLAEFSLTGALGWPSTACAGAAQ